MELELTDMTICLLIDLDDDNKKNIYKITEQHEVSFFSCNFFDAIQTFETSFEIYDCVIININFNQIVNILKLSSLIFSKRPDLSVVALVSYDDQNKDEIAMLRSRNWFICVSQVSVRTIQETAKKLMDFFK